jgi:high-affinity iron transporter
MFAQHGCAVCHGAEGRGDGPSAKRLDVPPGDFADPRTYRQGVSPNDIAASIRNGAGAMPAFHDISDAESADIAAWIVSLQGGARTARGRP